MEFSTHHVIKIIDLRLSNLDPKNNQTKKFPTTKSFLDANL
jgi:hypothetical protein